MTREPRYRWLGSVPHARALRWLASSHVLVVSSGMEGGANVIAEAARIGVPVLASRISGNVGMLGRGYPGFYPLYDERRGLAGFSSALPAIEELLRQAAKSLLQRKPHFAPAAERGEGGRSLQQFVDAPAHRLASQ